MINHTTSEYLYTTAMPDNQQLGSRFSTACGLSIYPPPTNKKPIKSKIYKIIKRIFLREIFI